jgi:putative heme-binding domain-containing protein
MFWLVLLLAQSAVPTQIDRGEAIFMDPARGCAGCHALKGKGTAVGPDLRDIARLSPKGIAMAIHSTVTQYVQVIKLKSGRSFPGMPPKGDQTHDLSKTPPEAVNAPAAEIASTTANNGWKHPPSAAKFTNAEMADLIAYLRFAGANNRQPVSPDDVQ